MSWLSKILNKQTGLPEVDLRKKGKDPILSALIEQLASQQAAELVRKLPDDQLAMLLKATKDETRRRLDE